jgi:hypothetical protein
MAKSCADLRVQCPVLPWWSSALATENSVVPEKILQDEGVACVILLTPPEVTERLAIDRRHYADAQMKKPKLADPRWR